MKHCATDGGCCSSSLSLQHLDPMALRLCVLNFSHPVCSCTSETLDWGSAITLYFVLDKIFGFVYKSVCCKKKYHANYFGESKIFYRESMWILMYIPCYKIDFWAVKFSHEKSLLFCKRIFLCDTKQRIREISLFFRACMRIFVFLEYDLYYI